MSSKGSNWFSLSPIMAVAGGGWSAPTPTAFHPLRTCTYPDDLDQRPANAGLPVNLRTRKKALAKLFLPVVSREAEPNALVRLIPKLVEIGFDTLAPTVAGCLELRFAH